ncbi:unnamed protein product, partial [Onchocerca ochengi]
VYQTIYEDGVCILKIQELAIEDEGEYTCEAVNDAGQAITKCFLQTITEADVLKYQQQAIFKKILYSNGGSNTNNSSDNLAFLDNLKSLSDNTGGIMYRNPAANCEDLIEWDDNSRDYLVVNYEFDRTEPLSAETAVIVTRYTSSQKEFRKNFASQERSFNISVFLPDAAVECAFVWTLINCEKTELSLMSSFQTVNFVIQNFQPQQVQKADLLLYVKKLILENVSFAICQPWEEILLVKKPENSFIWDSEYCWAQKARVEIFIKISKENVSSQNQPVKNIVLGSDYLSHSFAYFDVVGKDDTKSLTSQANSTLPVKENINISEKANSEQNEEMVRYKDEQEESQIPILPQKITKEKQEVDILIRNDDNKFKYELSWQKFEDPEINTNILSAIRQYVDELFDFDPVKAIICEQKDVNKLNTTSNQIESGLDFADKVYLDCSFRRSLEHAEASENRNLSVSEMETLASSSSHLTGNFSSSRIASLNLNPISKNMVSSKKSIESKAEVRSLACEANCDSNEDSKQNLDNPGNKKLHSKLDTCNSFTTPDIHPHPGLSTKTYLLHSANSIESTDAGQAFDASEEFEVFSASANPRLQHDESFSTPPHPSANKFYVLGAEHSKSSHVRSEIVKASTSNTRISTKESLPTHDTTTDELPRTGVADKIRKDIEDEIKMKSKDNEKVFQIERAIYEISEQIEKIERRQSLTEAQAEAGEELLKTVLENIIKNVGQDSVVETMVAYKKPVVLLREKLTDLEETLMGGDLESRNLSKSIPEAEPIFSKSLNEEDLYAVRQSSIEREIRGTSLCALRQVGIIDKEEIRRMTPLTSNIKEQLQSLECMLEEVEKEEENDMKELNEEIKVTIPVYSDDKRHEVHSILMQINNEISFIKRSCQRNISKTSVDAAIRLLHKVRNNVSSMIDLISLYRKRFKRKSLATNRERMKLSKRTSRHLSPTSKTGFFFKADASVNFYLVKREESEIVNAIVKLCSSSNNSENQMSRSQNSEISTYDDALFDDKSMMLQETGINNAPWTAALEPAAEKNDKITLSNFGEPQSNSFSLNSLQDSQEAVPIPPPRRLRGISQQSFPPPIPPPRLKRRSKSCDNYKNLLILSCTSDTQNSLSPMHQNMTTNEKGEVSIYASDYSDPVNIKDLEDAEESNLSTFKQKSEKLNEINSDRIISKEGDFYSCSYTWPSKVNYLISFEIFDESSPMQLLCEDSDYLPESLMHSFLFFEPTKRGVQEENEEELLQTLELLSDLNTSKVETIIGNATKRRQNFAKLKDEREAKNFHPIQESTTPELDESYNQCISECLTDVDQKINENSKMIENPRNSSSEDENFEDIQKSAQHLHASSNTKARESTITNPLEDEANSLHEIESIDDGDEILDDLDDLMVICNPHTDIIDGIDLLSTIMENSKSSKVANPFMSMSTNTVISVGIPDIDIPTTSQDVQQIVVEDKKQSDITTPTLESSLERKNLTAKTVNVPFSRSNKDGVNYLDSYKKKIILICEDDTKQISEETTINVIYKSCSSKLKVLATLSPEVRAQVEACAVNEEDFDVLVEQPDEAQDFTVKLLDHISDSISLDLKLSNTVEVNLSLIRSEQYEGILSYQVGYLTGGETDEERISATSDYEQHNHSSKTTEDRVRHTGISVNIVARSMHDVARASLEEIPWGKVSMYIVMQPLMTRSISDSGTRNSLVQNVTVSESNETEKRSLHSHESFRSSSRQSFDWTEFSDRSASWQNLSVPSYVVREGSTATITCEFNNFLAPGSLIDWFKGKTIMQIVPGKTDRISHDLLEVLVISHVSLMDGDVYSIRVNDIIYPVACLIVENVDTSSEKINSDIHFISPPQTLFVMEGQPSIISCQVNSANQKVEWCKDNKKWVTENERIQLEADQFGFHRIIIDKSELEDQGTYYAFLGDHFTTVTLVVEERIDEREVTISALGTETGEDDYREYLVPLGSTATIACELENSDEVQELVWRKNDIQIEFSDDAKLEHVVNGLKHYLVIHDTQADDSASYSICINGEYPSQVTVEESLVPVGSAATIHCETITQQYSLDWRKNLQPITQNERIEKKDTADGFEHSLTIHSVRKNDEGEYGVVIKDSYTVVTKISVIESQEQIATEDFDISLHPTPSLTNEAFAQLYDRVNLQNTFEAYQLCNMEEYFDLQFSMQSFEIPVIVDERRSASVSYLSRQLSIQTMEKEIDIHREPSYATSKDLTFMEVTIVECNFVTTNARFEFTSTSVAHAVAESIVLTLVAQQFAQIHLSSQYTELRASFINQSNVEQLTATISKRPKIVEKLETKLSDCSVKLDVILLSPMQTIATDIVNKIPTIIALEMHFLALIFEDCNNTITFNRTPEREFCDAVMRTKLITFPEMIRRQFIVNNTWLELIAVYKVPQIFDSTIKIAVARKEMLYLQCKASKANMVDEIFAIWKPIQQQDIAITFPVTLSTTTSENYIDSISSLEIMLQSHLDRNLLTSKKIPLIRMEMISMELTAASIEVFPVTYNFSKSTQDENVEVEIFVKPLIHYETSQRNFTDSVTKVELDFWSKTERSLFVIDDFRAVEMDQLSARFSGSVEEYFTISTAFNTQSELNAALATLLIKAPKIVEKTNRLFSDTTVSVLLEYQCHVSREFCADTIFLTSQMNACMANFRVSTCENLYAIASSEIQSQENNASITLLMRAPTIFERSIIFSDDLVQKTAEIQSQIERSLEVEKELFTARKDTLIKNIKSAQFNEKDIIVMIEERPKKEISEIILLSPLPALIQKFSRSFSDAVVNLTTELYMESFDFHADHNIQIGRTHALQMHLKASKEENISLVARFYIQDEIEKIMATLPMRAPSIIAKNDRKFSDSVVKFATELWSQICREAFVDVDIYIARKDNIQRQFKASSVEDTFVSIALEEYPEAEELEVILSEIIQADIFKLSRFFSYKTVDLIATLWSQAQSNSYVNLDVPIKRKNSNQLYLKTSSEEYRNTSTSFEAQTKAGNITTVLQTQVPSVVEKSSRKFSDTTAELTTEIWSQLCHETFANRSIYSKQKDSVKLDLNTTTFEVQIFLTNFELQSQVENITAVLPTRAPTIVEGTNMVFSSDFTKIVSEMFSTVNRDLHTSVEAKVVAQETSEAWIEAAKEENSYIKTHFEVQSEASYSDAIVSIVQKERQFTNVQVPSLENIEIYTAFEFYQVEN